jgi:site-specific DNA recombinase
VEANVEAYYLRDVRIHADQVAWLEPRVVKAFRETTKGREHEVARQRRTIDRIHHQRRQLVASHLANPKAVPLDLLEEKEAALAADLAAAEHALRQAEANLEKAATGLRSAGEQLVNASTTYRDAGPALRRAWNQAFFTKLLVREDGVVGAQMTPVFGDLLKRTSPHR